MEGIVANLRMLKKKATAVRDGAGGFGASSASGSQSSEAYIDAFNRRRQPTSRDLLRELKNTAFSCIFINAWASASFPPMPYYKSSPGLPMPKSFDLEIIPWLKKKSLDRYPWWKVITKASKDQFALPMHPLNDLFQRGNWRHSGINLWNVTHQFIEAFGVCYWYVPKDLIMGLPAEIRIMPTQDVEPKYDHQIMLADPWERAKPSHYEWYITNGHQHTKLEIPPEDVVEFHMPDLNNIYQGGRAPHHAGHEYSMLQSEYIAHRLALWKNRGRPDFIASPATGEYMGRDEMSRMEKEWRQKFSRGGAGLPLFSSTPLRVDILQFLENQVSLLAEHGATKEDILNMFGVPVSFYTRETNMANLAASRELHTSLTIRPRNHMRDEVITKRLCSLYDPTGALFASSEDPVPEDEQAKWNEIKVRLETGLSSINMVLTGMLGEPAVVWGNEPIMPTHFAPLDINLIQELRERLRYGDMKAADTLESLRTRPRLEDMNDPNKPMSDYAHTETHGPEGKALERRRKEEQQKKDKDDGETKKKAYPDQTPVVNNWNLPAQPPPHIVVNVPELKMPEIKVDVAAPTVNYEPPDVHVDVAAPNVNVAAPDVSVAAPKVEVTNQAPAERKPRVRKARWKDDDGKEHEITIEG